MSEKYVLVEHSSAINTIIHKTFQTTQRLKFTAFDVSKKYIIFGTTSGGIYIFTREPCQFLKLIPSTHGATSLLRISPNEENLAIAGYTGLVIVLENCFTPQFEQQVFSEHENSTVTAMAWNGSDLYCGDSTGRVSVITVKNFLTKAMFHAPVACLMHLDSHIIQLDIYSKFLLVSTQTRTLLCDTETEMYRQIGKKMRDGPFGACFLAVGGLPEVPNNPPRAWGVFRTVTELEELAPFVDSNVKIYCARPGVRLWQADFQANVVITHQFRSSLSEKPSNIVYLSDCDQLNNKKFEGATIGQNFNFGKIFALLGNFVLTFREEGIYIFEPSLSALTHWSLISNIKDVKIVDSFLYIWHNDMDVKVLGLLTVEELILRSLFRKKYRLSGELCLEFFEEVNSLLKTSKKIHLISSLESKLEDSELSEKLEPIFSRLKESARLPNLEKLKNGIVAINVFPVLPESVENYGCEIEEKDELAESISILSEQFKINKIQKTIETVDFIQLMQSLDSDSLHKLLIKFQEKTNEDCDFWCKDVFLKNANTLTCSAITLQYACDAFLQVNHCENLVCKCDFPLPRAHQIEPKYYQIGYQIMERIESYESILKNIPSMYKYTLKKLEPQHINSKISFMIQFSDRQIIEFHSKKISYDVWDESITLLWKLKKGQCLHCGTNIDITGCIEWTQFAVLMAQSIKPLNAIKLLKRHSHLLPKGELDPFFYQFCIFATATNIQSNILKNTLGHENVKRQFEKSVGGYLRKKHLSDEYDPPINKSVDNCDHCQLPLKLPVLEEQRKLKCGHKYHQLCFSYNENQCCVCKASL